MNKKLILIFFVALAVRVALLVHVGDSFEPDHGQLANLVNWREGHGLSDTITQADGSLTYQPTARDLPGHGIIILTLWELTGTRSILPIKILQIFLDSLMVFLLYGIGKKIFNEKISLLGALFYSLYLPAATLAVWPRRDAWVSFGIITAIYLFLRYLENQKWRTCFGVGLVLAWTSYFRSTMIPIPLLFGYLISLFHGWKKSLTPTVLMGILILSALLPWGIRNYKTFNGKMILTEVNFYQSMWEGFGQFPNPMGAINHDALTEKQMRAAGYQGEFASIEYEDFLKPKVVEALQKHPWWYLGTIFRRIPRALIVNRVHWGIFQKKNLEYHTFHLKTGRDMSLIQYALFMLRENPGFLLTKCLDLVILVFAIYGLLLMWRTNRRYGLLLGSLPLYFMLVLIPIRMEGRYMTPIHWVFLLLMAYSLLHLKERLNKKVIS